MASVYPKPPDANGDNAAATLHAGRVQEAVGKLAEALRPLPEDGSLNIANPVHAGIIDALLADKPADANPVPF